MIVRMRKLSVLLYHRQRDEFIKAIQDIGVVHVEERSDVSSESLTHKSSELKSYEQANALLDAHAKHRKILKIIRSREKRTPEDVLTQFHILEKQKTSLEHEQSGYRKMVDALTEWGEFDPEILAKLASVGIRTRFFSVPLKDVESVQKETPDLKQVAIYPKYVLFVLFERGEPVAVNAEEIVLPAASLSDSLVKLADAEDRLEEVLRQMDALLAWKHLLEEKIALLQGDVSYESARLSFADQAQGKVLYLEGWFPYKREKELHRKVETFNAVARFYDPAPGDVPPVLLKNNAYSRLFEPITRLFSTPDYFELDPTPFFAPFFMLFVGLCLGDLAYGSIIFLGCVAGLLFLPQKFKSLAALGAVIGASVMVCGILLNSVFGTPIFGGPGIPEGSSLFASGAEKFALLSAVESGEGTFYPMMGISLFIGIVQIHLGLILCAVNRIRLGNIGGAIRPVADMLLILGAIIVATHTNAFELNIAMFTPFGLPIGKIPLLIPYPVALGMVMLGTVLFLAFDSWGTPFFKKIGWSFFNLYLFISGALGNMLSYMRLFALGLSGGMLGMVFNTLALGLITKDGVVNPAQISVIGTVVILVVGHTLNFGLSILGSFVHPLRLTFLEFFSSLDFKGNGKQYKPLMRPVK